MDFYCVFVRTEINLIAFLGPRDCVNTQYAALSGAMKSCQRHKLGSLLLSSRCMTNYMKTCSIIHAHYAESMKMVENLF